MIWNPFKVIPKKSLGIDIGTTAIKIVELSQQREKIKLENYGEVEISALYETPFRTFEGNTFSLSTRAVASAISAVIEEAKIDCNQVTFSIPDFSSFFTNFRLPPMTEEELPQAVKYEARVHIPLPLSEVALDWQVIGGKVSETTPLDILLVSIPLEIIAQYQAIAGLSNLALRALEAEVFGFLRSSVRNETKIVCLVDIGAQSTTISIVDNKILKRSHSFNVAGNEFTQRIATALNVDYNVAKELKEKYGILPQTLNKKEPGFRNLREILLPLVDLIIIEIGKTFEGFYQTEKKEVEKVILAGGVALLPGLKEYFFENIKKGTEIANPFSGFSYLPILKETLEEIGPAYAVVVGTALRGLEYTK